MEQVELVREEGGFSKSVCVDTWHDRATDPHHARITFDAYPRNELHFEAGEKTAAAAEKTA